MITVARNLQLNGVLVTVFGQQINTMRDWFPGIDIAPQLRPDSRAAKLAALDTVIQLNANRPFASLERMHPKVIVLAHPAAPIRPSRWSNDSPVSAGTN
ncbi:MAG: hypothetical protein QOD67_4635 [Caballeronia sp.]|jgi:hypothetical protein|nr:hypothetical protein [Caballeronia sp.]